MHGEGISTPRIRHKGRQPLIECARHDFMFMYFPFFIYFFIFLAFYVFFSFLWSTRVFPSLLSILNCDEEIDLRSSFIRTERWLSCFDLFPQDRF